MTTPPTEIETKEVITLRDEASSLVEMAESLEVTAETLNDASDLLSWIAANKKRLEKQRVFLTKPLVDHQRAINGQFKDWMDPLNQADRAVRQKVLAYQREEERKAAEARAAEEKRQREEQERLAAEREASGDASPMEPAAPQPVAEAPQAPERSTRSSLGTTTVRKVWTFEIEDESAIPREYLAVDEKKIGAVVKAGVRSIPGVRIYQTDSLAVRSR